MFGYDSDSLLKSAKAITENIELLLEYDTNPTTEKNGLLRRTELWTDPALKQVGVTEDYGYNSFGEVNSYTANTSTDGGTTNTAQLSLSYVRDKLGRITEKTEIIGGVTTKLKYEYDLAGRLDIITDVTVTGSPIVMKDYLYDANGNRTSEDNGTTTIGFHDDQDRLTDYNGVQYSYTFNGELMTRDDNGSLTRYTYDVLGNLTKVEMPNGDIIEYIIDSRNRRVGKKLNGTLIKGWLYKDQLNPIAEYDGSGNLTARFIYASRINVPDYMIKNGVTYRIASDHLGSPRLVIDISTGNIVQQINYDEWGNITLDTNPGFQPFSFAGGLYDQQTQIIRFGFRDYDPIIGRWTSKDPIRFNGGDTSLFSYSKNDPINLFDIFGLLFPRFHYDISYISAINHGATPEQAREFAEKVVAVDEGTQGTSPDDTRHHYMAGEGQTYDEAIANAEAFINDPNTSLAKKAHALQDGAAPWHKGQLWENPYTSPIDAFFHGQKDNCPEIKVLLDALSATDALLDKHDPWNVKNRPIPRRFPNY